MEAIIVAICAATLPAYFSYRANRHARNVDKKTDTNHGKEPWEYLEMIQDVKDLALATKATVLETKHTVLKLEDSFRDHSQLDTENFEELRGLIKEQQ